MGSDSSSCVVFLFFVFVFYTMTISVDVVVVCLCVCGLLIVFRIYFVYFSFGKGDWNLIDFGYRIGFLFVRFAVVLSL